MLKTVHPKLPMRDKAATKAYYTEQLGFKDIGVTDYPEYLMLKRDEVELHFFLFKDLDPLENYGQAYIRVQNIETIYRYWEAKGLIHPNDPLQTKPWGLKEFSVLDPDHNCLTIGEDA